MPTSLRTKIVGLGRHASEEGKSHREPKTISFANANNPTYEEMLMSSTPGLHPAEISIDVKVV